MRYWQPAPELRAAVSGYHLYAVDPPSEVPQRDAFQPAGPILRFTFADPIRWRVRPPRGEWGAVPPIALFGPTDGVTWSESGPGVTVGVGILPRGWARLSAAPAASWANRVAPPGGLRLDLAELARALAAAPDDAAIPAAFDQAIAAGLAPCGPEDAQIAAFERALLEAEVDTVAELARRIGRPVRSTERFAMRAFGFPPKRLIRRARFLRSLHALGEASPAERAGAIDYGYTDYSHFVRDAQAFLGMSPQAFLRLDNPMLRQSLALRREVLGTPAQALAGSGS
jgi:AraC-like DNA-binding protein